MHFTASFYSLHTYELEGMGNEGGEEEKEVSKYRDCVVKYVRLRWRGEGVERKK